MKKLQMNWRTAIRGGVVVLACLALVACRSALSTRGPGSNDFSFAAAGDMRNFAGPAPAGKRYFDGACAALQQVGAGEFMISPGDFDPPGPVRATLDRYLGTNYLWYPVVGNHEIETPANMAWVHAWADRGIPHLVQHGPPGAEVTTYSFDFGNSHFAAVNEYYDGHSEAVAKGGISDAALDWLEKDLAATRQPLVWVVGHIPIESLPDMDTGRVRHKEETVSPDPARHARFMKLLKDHHVRAYICGHTHDSSIARIEGVWQADSGHARGAGDPGAPSTFLKFRISGQRAWVDVYRADATGERYELKKTVELD